MLVRNASGSLFVVSLRRKATFRQGATHRLRKRPSRIQALETKTYIDVFACPCGGRMRVISVIEDLKLIKIILDHLKRPSGVPKIHQARAPPQLEFFDVRRNTWKSFYRLPRGSTQT